MQAGPVHAPGDSTVQVADGVAGMARRPVVLSAPGDGLCSGPDRGGQGMTGVDGGAAC